MQLINPRTIDTHILSLRKKIETDPRQPSLIQTVRNVGYRFNLEILNGTTPSIPSALSNNQRNSSGRAVPSLAGGHSQAFK